MRDEITIVELTKDAGVDGKAATVMTAINVTNGASIDVSSVTTDKLIIHVKNTYAGEKAITIKTGVFSRSPLGDLEVAIDASTGEKLICIETARFKQADETIYIDFAASMTGLVGAYLLP